jgi:hypothetical protein
LSFIFRGDHIITLVGSRCTFQRGPAAYGTAEAVPFQSKLKRTHYPTFEVFASFASTVLPSNSLRKREETGVQQVSVSQRAKAIRR